MEGQETKLIRIPWREFYNNIKLYRVVSTKELKYVGEYNIDGKVYTDEFIFTDGAYKDNVDEIGYIDKFAKEQIAKKLVAQINGSK